jgi:hypothetical protein
MTKLVALMTLMIAVFTTACEKEEKQNNTIDVSAQWNIDPFGVVISAPGPDQWNKKILSSSELALFSSMDTTGLFGTSAPTAMRDTVNYPFPNPFSSTHSLAFKFNNNYSGELILKYVIVDSALNVVEKKVARLTSMSGSAAVAIAPVVAAGKYRLYYTLSSQAAPNFYQSWGNIKRM